MMPYEKKKKIKVINIYYVLKPFLQNFFSLYS